MKLTTDIKLVYSQKQSSWVGYFNVPDSNVDELNKIVNKNGLKSIEIKQYREKRSLTANAYAFQLMSNIAKLLTSTTEEIYEQMLHDYGVHVYSVVLPKDIADKKKDYKFVDPMNKVKVQTDKGLIDAVQIDCIRGSSKYDSLQMHHFIEGIKTECDTLGIETKTPEELKRMTDSWKGET